MGFLSINQVLECSKLQFTFQGQRALLLSHYTAEHDWDYTINMCLLQKKACSPHMHTKPTVTEFRNTLSVLTQSWWNSLYLSQGKAQPDLAVVRVLGDTPQTLTMGRKRAVLDSWFYCRNLLDVLTLLYSKKPPAMKKRCILSPAHVRKRLWCCIMQKLLEICVLHITMIMIVVVN